MESARSTFNKLDKRQYIQQDQSIGSNGFNNPILNYNDNENGIGINGYILDQNSYKDLVMRKNSLQHLQTGIDNTKLGESVTPISSNLVAEKYSRGRCCNCFSSIACTPCIVKTKSP